MGILGIIFGVLAILTALIWSPWFGVIIAVVGIVISFIGMGDEHFKIQSTIGIILAVVGIIAALIKELFF